MRNNEIPVPLTSTIYKKIETHVYYCKDENAVFENSLLEQLKEISEKVANLKEKIVHVSWHDFFYRVIDIILNNFNLEKLMYATQEEFYKEDVKYRDMNTDYVRSNQIKYHLHWILTKAIFEYKPCCELLEFSSVPPDWRDWANTKKFKWTSVNADPYQNVSHFVY